MGEHRSPVALPGALPLLGHAPAFLRDRLGFLTAARGQGAVVAVRLGPGRTYLVNDPGLVRSVLAKQAGEFGLSPQFRVMRRIIGNGLLATDGPFHRSQRKLMHPAFRHERIAEYGAAMSELTERRLGGWQSGEVRDLVGEFSELATEIAVRCLFSAGADERDAAAVAGALPHLMAWAGSRGMDPTGLLAKLPTPLNFRLRRGMADFDRVLHGVIGRRRAAGAERRGEDLLGLLLGARDAATGEPLPDQQVHDEALSFLLAGTESVSRTLAWAVHLLARNPEVATRLRQEVDGELAGRTAEFADLERLPYTRLLLHETLRLYPPGYLVSRASLADVRLGEYLIPAGSTVMFSYYALQRDPERFPEPERCDPLRWERPGAAGREAFLPFGLGAHGCLGEGFAWCELALVLASLAARWECEPLDPGPVRPVAAFSLTLAGLPVRLHARAAPRIPRQSTATHRRTEKQMEFEALTALLVELGIPEDAVTPAALREEAGLDSLAVAELVLLLERDHGLSVTEEEVHATTTLGELAELLGAKRAVVRS
ncbi:cytochrome P450 [Kitasatospora sp. NPDC002227]|uniref:cytochrome P450 n=1 Tax=Kitasatospora sp. NPDC002227 TaxID=3154773 RepID=UPI003324F9C1